MLSCGLQENSAPRGQNTALCETEKAHVFVFPTFVRWLKIKKRLMECAETWGVKLRQLALHMAQAMKDNLKTWN